MEKNEILITFVIPSYNSENYLEKCIDSILKVKENIEIIIVNDGSKDNTLAIANRYKQNHPEIVKVIDQENGGHGEGINQGILNANGIFLKVVDSDDWVDERGLHLLYSSMRQNLKDQKNVDIYIMDFIYEHVEDNTTFTRKYQSNFYPNKITSWSNLRKKFRFDTSLLMHSIIYKTEVLKKSKLILPKHTFYVDNIFAYTPLAYTKDIVYIPHILYHYFIGRPDQSIQIKNFTNRYEQQLKVMKNMLFSYTYEEIMQMEKGLRQYMLHCLTVIMLVTQTFTYAKYEKERINKLTDLWQELKHYDIKLYRKLKYGTYNTFFIWLPGKIKSKILLGGYFYAAKKIKLG